MELRFWILFDSTIALGLDFSKVVNFVVSPLATASVSVVMFTAIVKNPVSGVTVFDDVLVVLVEGVAAVVAVDDDDDDDDGNGVTQTTRVYSSTQFDVIVV